MRIPHSPPPLEELPDELLGAAFPDAEEFLDGAAVQKRRGEIFELSNYFVKSMKPLGFGRHVGIARFTMLLRERAQSKNRRFSNVR